MSDVEYRIALPGQVLQDFWDSDYAIQIIQGPYGSGKSVTTINKIVHLMAAQEPDGQKRRKTRWVAVRNTYAELFSTTIKDFLECHEDLGTFKAGGSSGPPMFRARFALEDGTTVDSEIIFVSFDRPDDVKKAKGMNITGVWVNECSEIDKASFDALSARFGRYPRNPTWSGMLCDTNGFDTDHYLYAIATASPTDMKEIYPDYAYFKQPGGVVNVDGKWVVNKYAENAQNLPKGYYRRLMQNKTDDWIKVYIANEFAFHTTGKPVHPHYVDSVHCMNLDFHPDVDEVITLGFDFGRDPACAFIQKTPVGGYICFDEFVGSGMGAVSFAPELAKYIRQKYPEHQFEGYGDPSGTSGNQANDETPFKILNENGIPAMPTERSNNVLLRRSAIEKPLKQICMDGRPRLIILPKAVTIRKGLAGGFAYKRVMIGGDARFHDKPDKNKYSHPVEALEYALVGVGEGEVELDTAFESQYDDWNVAVN